MLSLSTAWIPDGAFSLKDVLAGGRKLGFDVFELGVSAVPFDMRAASAAIEDGVKFSSCHAITCERDIPRPTKRGDWVGSLNEDERRLGVELLKDNVSIARRLGVSVIILHGGFIAMPGTTELQFELFRLAQAGTKMLPRRPELDALFERRAKLVAPHLDALARSLAELCEYAGNIRLALENRFYLNEFPYGDEFAQIFERVNAPNLGYWHDVGHAHVLERIGCVPQAQLFEKYAPKLIGMHLHDIKGFEDHQPPGAGDFDFGVVLPLLAPRVIRVLEIGPKHTARQVKKGRDHLARKYGIE